MTPSVIELRMSRIDSTILTILTQVVRATAPAVSVAPSSTMATIPKAETGCYVMAFLATPVAVPLYRVRNSLIDRSLSFADCPFAEGGR